VMVVQRFGGGHGRIHNAGILIRECLFASTAATARQIQSAYYVIKRTNCQTNRKNCIIACALSIALQRQITRVSNDPYSLALKSHTCCTFAYRAPHCGHCT
jgi:hypothetical protein